MNFITYIELRARQSPWQSQMISDEVLPSSEKDIALLEKCVIVSDHYSAAASNPLEEYSKESLEVFISELVEYMSRWQDRCLENVKGSLT